MNIENTFTSEKISQELNIIKPRRKRTAEEQAIRENIEFLKQTRKANIKREEQLESEKQYQLEREKSEYREGKKLVTMRAGGYLVNNAVMMFSKPFEITKSEAKNYKHVDDMYTVF